MNNPAAGGRFYDAAVLAAAAALGASFLFPKPAGTFIFLALPVLFLFRGVLRGEMFRRTSFDVPILILLLQVLITCFIVPDIEFSLPKIAGILFGIMFFYALGNVVDTEKWLRAGFWIFLLGGAAFSVFGIVGVKMLPDEVKHLDIINRVIKALPKYNFGLIGAEQGFDTNAIAGTLVLFLPLGFFWALAHERDVKAKTGNRGRLKFALSAGVFLFMAFTMILTQSRASWGGLFISGLAAWLAIRILKKRKIAKIIVLIPFLAAGAGLSYFLLVDKNEIPMAQTELKDKYFGRLQAWSVGVEVVKKHPLTGIGMNYVRLQDGIGYERAHVHNHFIHTAAEMGLPALVAYLAILINMFWMCFRVGTAPVAGWIKMGVAGLGCGQAAHVIFGFADSIPLGAKPGLVFWVSLALISSAYRLSRRDGLASAEAHE